MINIHKKTIFIVLVTLMTFILSGTAVADDYVGGEPLNTNETGTVSGGIYTDSYYGMNSPTPTNVTYNFQDLPSSAEVNTAKLVTAVYCGHMQNNYNGNVNITFNGQQIASEVLDTSYSYPGEGGTGTVWLNDHMNRVTSDYMIWYDVTSLVQQSNTATVTTSKISPSFDGRIKLITLIVTYNDGDSDFINYWINMGHDVSSYYDESYVGLTNFIGFNGDNVQNSTLTVFHLASSDGTYNFNGNILPSGSPQGSYSGSNTWNVTANYNNNDNALNYHRTGNHYKILMAILTAEVKTRPELEVEILNLPGTVSLGEEQNIEVNVRNTGSSSSGEFLVQIFNNNSLIGTQNITNLDPTSSTTLNFNWIPTTLGTYEIIAIVDPEDQVDESNEDNNEDSSQCIVTGSSLSDLNASNWIISSPIYVDDNYQLNVTIYNTGNAATSTFKVKFFDNNVLIDTQTVYNLDSNSDIILTFNWTPGSTGEHLLKVEVDSDSEIPESNESNNTSIITVTADSKLPDLVVSSINTPSIIEIGKNYLLIVNVNNNGSGNSDGGNLSLYNGTTLLGTQSLGNINAGESSHYNFNWIPSIVGENNLIAVVDQENVVQEVDDNNNQLTKMVITKDAAVKNVLIVSDNPGTAVLNMAAHEVLDMFPGMVSIQIRSNSQICEMEDIELLAHLQTTDIFIGNWISTQAGARLESILELHPEILNNKPVFLILETDINAVKLMKYSTINGVNILDSFTIVELTNYRENTRRGGNFNNIQDFVTNSSFPSNYNTATLYKSVEDKSNALNEILWALNISGFSTSYEDPQSGGDLDYGIYRYKWYNSLEEYMADYFQDDRPTIGVIESTAYLKSGNLEVYYNIIDELEARGLNVIPVLAAGGSSDQLMVMVENFTNAPDVESFLSDPGQYQCYVDVLVQMQAYGLGGDSFTKTTEFFTYLNAPVIRAIHSDYLTNQDWELSSEGLSTVSGDRWWHIAILEAQGIIEPTFIGGKSTYIDPKTGAAIIGYIPQEANIERMTDKIKNWTVLRYLPNTEKFIALIYYNYPPGKNNIGASYLDTVASIFNLLYLFQEQGYTVDNIPENEDDLLALILSQGINIANWAPGDLEILANNPNVLLYPVSDYLTWFNLLDPLTQKWVTDGPTAYIGELCRRAVELNNTADMNDIIDTWQAEIVALLPSANHGAEGLINNICSVLKQYVQSHSESDYNTYLALKEDFMDLNVEGLSGWGEAPGNIMTIEKNGIKYLVLPGIQFGNIFIGPQPQRGWEGDVEQLYHNSRVPPHHQYLALYAYLQQQEYNAMVHVGRHGTHEWLPGKEVVLACSDFPMIVTGSIPQINYYIIDGLAEGIQVKRRAGGVIIDHLTPPMTFTQLYGGLSLLAKLADEYEDATVSRRLEIITEVKTIIAKNHLEGDMGGSIDNLSNDELIQCINTYLSDVQSTLYPYGLHTIGEPWSDEKMALLVTSMLGVAFEVNGGTSYTTLQNEVALVMFGKLFIDCNAQEKDDVQDKCIELVKSLIHEDVATVVLSLTSNPSSELIFSLEKAVEYINLINISLEKEVINLFDALNGGFVDPGPGVEPVTNPDALPTGRNFYHDQSSEIPTQDSYDYGETLALLAMQDMEDDTEKIVMGIWCVETARDDGALVAMVMHLLGMAPQWSDSPSAGPNGQKLKEMPVYIELQDLVRPDGWEKKRIDVVVITSGLFRDLYSRQAVLMDKCFRIALARSYNTILSDTTLMSQYGDGLKSSLNKVLSTVGYYGLGSESLNSNYVAKHWVEDYIYYLDQGMNSDTAAEMAICRIFAPPSGDYGAGISKSAQLSWTMEDRMEMADFYLQRMGHIYTENNWGLANTEVFKRALTNVGTVFTSRNTNLYGLLDNDDFFDYWGGLSLAMERVNGQAPNMFVLKYADRYNPSVMTIENYLNRELTTRYFNPAWISGMMGEGYSGSRQISQKFVENLWGWQITRPGSVQNWMWDEIVNVYVDDKLNTGVTEWMSNGKNAYSMISVTSNLLSAAHKGYYKTDSATMRKIANKWGSLIIKNGINGDHHTHDHAMIEYAMQYMDKEMLSKFKETMYKSTKNPIYAPGSGNVEPGTTNPGTTPGGSPSPGTSPSTSTSSSSGSSSSAGENSQASSQGSSEAGQDSSSQDTGDGNQQVYEIYDKIDVEKVESAIEELPYGPLAALLMISLVAIGYFKRVK
ncbi:MAG: cobaltochelatase subunit CobN [Methanomicrobiales archaeon]